MKQIPEQMMAAVHYGYGEPDLLKIEQIRVPSPKPNQYLVSVKAIALNPADWKYLEGRWRFFTGNRFPRQVGIEFAGVVVRAGSKARMFSVGQEVFGSVNAFKTGTAAEYVCAPESAMHTKPSSLSFAEAAGIPIAGGTAYMGFRGTDSDLSGKRVLVTGAGGGVGHIAVQFAHMLGGEVTAVCSSEKASFVRDLGANAVYDYHTHDVFATGETYDLIFDCAGTIGTRQSKRILTIGGEYLLLEIAGKLWLFAASWLSQRFARKKMRTFLAHPSGSRAAKLAELFGEKKLVMTLGGEYPLERVAEAMGVLKNGHAKGKIIVTIAPE